ncbi:MAG: phenylpropionate dioxygenase-like ring-hydroxylating dioxygenase large terminal subunit [Yoonia sp.]|jgi:phenylpropionate dioxygenase-like ring-hydroxylating dioxygenase large terminal subunit
MEIAKIFQTGWFGLGRCDQVKEAGDFITLDLLGQSLILLRDRDGRLRVLANTCRHRAARLLNGTGNCRGIRRPFHSWAYRLDGSLVSAPQMDTVEGFDRDDHALVQYRVEERLGFVFACLNPDAAELDVALGDFAQVHAPWPMETLVSTRRRETVVECNWKVFLDVFNEYYHLPFVHADSVDALYEKPDVPTEVTGAYVSQFGATEGTGGLLQTEQDKALPQMPGLSGREAAGVRYTWIFPNMTFAAGTDALWVYESYPLGPNRCHVVQTACFPPETLALPEAETKIAAYHSRLDAALAKDVPALENQQKGFAHPDAKQGPFHPLLEANVAGFAHWYANHMLRSLDALQDLKKEL